MGHFLKSSDIATLLLNVAPVITISSVLAKLMPIEATHITSILFIAVGLFQTPSDTARSLPSVTPFLVTSLISLLGIFPDPSDIVTLQEEPEGTKQIVGAKIRIEPLRHSFATMKRKLSTVLAMDYPITLEISVDLWHAEEHPTRRKEAESAKAVLKRVFQELLLPQCHRWQTLSFELPNELLRSLDEILGDVPADWTGLVGLTGVDFKEVHNGSYLGQTNQRAVTPTTVGLRPNYFAQSCNLASITFRSCLPDAPWTLPAFATTRRVSFSKSFSHMDEFLAVLQPLTATSPTALELRDLKLGTSQNAGDVMVDIQNVTSLVIQDRPNVLPDHMTGSEVLLRLRLPDLTRLEVSMTTEDWPRVSDVREVKDRSALALNTFLLSNPPILLNYQAVRFMQSELAGETKHAFEHLLIQRARKRQKDGWALLWGCINKSSSRDASLDFQNFPWPTLEIIDASQGELIQAADVERFIRILGASYAGSLPTLSNLRTLDLSWETCEKNLDMVRDSDKQAVERGVKIVRACLKDTILRTVLLRFRDKVHAVQGRVVFDAEDEDHLHWADEFPWLEAFKVSEDILADDVETFFTWLSSPVNWAREVRSILTSETPLPQDVETAKKVLRDVVKRNHPGADGARVIMRCLSALFEKLSVE
ncbi:hypothetical protein FA95DRAFT_928223 [Auriscalpium vulgare]|uniref:Uncharacterized protein n=1 Tax=Auriscalpium vulgare TaxID=40419 RepID=A0ACB8R7F9_9AGAM|nr:hypothetical protein FA95DRAFT_928223 [Auriscalpium vulgare]